MIATALEELVEEFGKSRLLRRRSPDAVARLASLYRAVGADLAFVNDEMLTLRAAAHYYHYSLRDDNEVLLYHPDWDVSLGADVNYHDRWLFHLHGILQSKMDGDFGARIPVRVGINAEIEYRHNRALSFFAKVDNLAFQRYTYFVHYPSLRALCLLGITYTL